MKIKNRSGAEVEAQMSRSAERLQRNGEGFFDKKIQKAGRMVATDRHGEVGEMGFKNLGVTIVELPWPGPALRVGRWPNRDRRG